jgi:LPS O-antigen subunit length determinant protein (WzzB/FepE family)
MKKGRIVWIAAIAAVLLAAAGYLTVTSRAKTDAAVAPPPAEVEVATVQQQDLRHRAKSGRQRLS